MKSKGPDGHFKFIFEEVHIRCNDHPVVGEGRDKRREHPENTNLYYCVLYKLNYNHQYKWKNLKLTFHARILNKKWNYNQISNPVKIES